MRIPDLYLGIDAGTGGVRAMAIAEDGSVVSQADVHFEPPEPGEPGTHEQEAEAWWGMVCEATGVILADLKRQRIPAESIRAIAVDGTSGTVVPVDGDGQPLRPALMYNDGRATEEADELNALAADHCEKHGYRFAASYALAKILWIRKNEPEVFEKTARFAHQADYILGRLSGAFGVSDASNALKAGYDLVDETWPAWMEKLPGVPERLPRVVMPGTKVCSVSRTAAGETGLAEGTMLVTGATDGTAAFLASGAKNPGDWNTSLGNTLVFKGISDALAKHPDGIVYSHKLPGRFWLPGAASNTGCEWIERLYPGEDLAEMDMAADRVLPTVTLIYPLVREGERFPFLNPEARWFCIPTEVDRVTQYAACLQGTAFIERIGYEVLEGVTKTTGGEVFATGGGSRSDVWARCRADVAGRRIHRPAFPESAFGSAILAAAGARNEDLPGAIKRMVTIERTFEPEPDRAEMYAGRFQRFRTELEERGYL
jgi:xylulokinase